jgi:thioredoxin 1
MSQMAGVVAGESVGISFNYRTYWRSNGIIFNGGLSSVTISSYSHFLLTSLNQKGILMASDLIKHISDASFEADVLQSDLPVLVDYWAEWCGPCRQIAPVLDELAETYKGKLQIAKMDVDANQGIPAQFGIRGIPTLMIFKGGKLVKTQVGAMSKGQMTALVAEHV